MGAPPDGDDGDGGDEPVTRRDLEAALRFVNAQLANGRDDLLRLAAQVVVLGEELARRLDAPLDDDAVRARTADILAADEQTLDRVELDRFADKYAATPADVPCAELIPICGARCCTMRFALSTQDLDEGVVRWDHGRPYLIRQRADGYCVHNDAATHGCTVHAQRPRICRTYSCKDDKRIWLDFERRVLAPPLAEQRNVDPPDIELDLHARARTRQLAWTMEQASLRR